MTLLDYVILGVLGCSVLLGAWRGLISEIIALVAWVAAFFIARLFGPALGAMLPLADEAVRMVAGFALVFILVLIAAGLLRLALRALLHAVGLALADRLLGAAFGILRGVALILVLALAAALTSAPRQAWWREAWLAPPLETALIALKPWLPKAVAAKMRFK
ncbi:MAG: CvpA family protein [Rhodocyclaceae bacterium]|nr:CvpA family protein [Rhodocyclaceae bacterium]MBX3666913.1 CvpA family protein [Rhodocyclaceae bacterium]